MHLKVLLVYYELSYFLNLTQLSPIKLSNQMDEALKAGAIGAKIVGSGGGGCMVVMVDEKNISKVKKAILSSGAKDVFEVNITN